MLIREFDSQRRLQPPASQPAMHPGFDRPAWQQPAYPERASPPPPQQQQSQTGWFPLQQNPQQQQQPQQSPVAHSQPQSVWLQDGDAEYSAASSPTQDQRVYASSPMYASVPAPTPPYAWTQSPPTMARPSQFIPNQTYPRPLPEPELYDRARDSQLQDQRPQAQTVLRRNKQIAIGRWNSEEHQWFLKGLEMFQGPAWGEIARLIGTRTSTQVRTHAQKFFTKLARLNQTIPYFEVQIQKERARLVAQGASVTPTAQSAPSNAALAATLSPRKRLASASNSPRQSLKRFKEEVAAATATSPTYAATTQTRYPQAAYDMKPRVYTGAYSPAASPSGGQWTTEDDRQWPVASPTSTTASIQLTQLQMDDGGLQPPAAAAADAESLPSMNKLLYRSAA